MKLVCELLFFVVIWKYRYSLPRHHGEDLNISFSPTLNYNKILQAYAVDKRVQITNVWDVKTAEIISRCLAKEIEYVYAYAYQGNYFEISETELKCFSQSQMSQFTKNLYNDASKGIGFLYGRQLIKDYNLKQPEILKAVSRFLNSEVFLQHIRDISGYSDITMASVKATRYTSGNFLTRHNDINPNENRRLAYVLGFSPHWHPDWGGLLQFYQQNGTPRDAWSPLFNSMSLFDVNHIHAVTFITPYAFTPRYSITGFFRAD